MNNHLDNQQENAEQHGEQSSNFLGEIPENWKRCARAAFGYIFCVYITLAVAFEIALAVFPETQWLIAVVAVLKSIEFHLYHFGIGLGVAIIAPCLAWEHLMYLREKRRREQEQRAREQEQRAREHAEAIVARLEKEVAELRRELDAVKAQTQPPRDVNGN